MKSVILLALAAIVVLGLYFMFTRSRKSNTEEEYQLTAVDEITTTNLEKNYPADPRKVIDLYARIMQVLYKEEYTDQQQSQMLQILAGLMDDELLNNQDNFYLSMSNEVTERKKEDYSISAYVVQTKEAEVTKVDGKSMCNVDCLFSLRHGTNGTTATYYQFILRKDDSGKWKILGWTLKEEE